MRPINTINALIGWSFIVSAIIFDNVGCATAEGLEV